MTPWLDDGDVRVHVGDVRDVLTTLPDESVDCVITSPPYWGLRDYGTGSWDGGDPACDHRHDTEHQKQGATSQRAGRTNAESQRNENFRDVCGKCGARRVDQQLGLEPTPDLYVQNMVAVFREIRRVLAPHGTCWLNLGDSYARPAEKGTRGPSPKQDSNTGTPQAMMTTVPPGLKEKDLVGIPWRVAFALQADGWWLRSEIIWAKPNPMPESVTDRPTKSHEQVFLLAKQPRYFFDAEAVREPHRTADDARNRPDFEPSRGRAVGMPDGDVQRIGTNGPSTWPSGGRNVRSVWEIATQPFPEAHFATYPQELVRRCLLAGCPAEVCTVCSKPRERIVERETNWQDRRAAGAWAGNVGIADNYQGNVHSEGMSHDLGGGAVKTTGWTDCGHNDYRPGVVLDPFLGSGTSALVARNHGRYAIGIELNPAYAEIASRRLQQLSLGVVT